MRLHRQRTSGSGFLPLDTSKRVLIPFTPVKLTDSWPIARNDNNTADAQEIKLGPFAWMKIGGTYHWWFEGVQNTGYPVNNGMTAFMKATSTSPIGPMTFSPATSRILDAGDTSTWEYYEFSPSDVVSYGGNLIFTAHGGNNSGPAGRQGGRVISTDTAAGVTGFTKDPNNPLIKVGAVGSWDEIQSGNDLKLCRYHNNPGNPFNGALWGTYRGRKSTGPITDGLLGRVTVSPDYATFTKDTAAAGQVIFSAPSGNTGGITSGTPVFDEGGRAHMWAPGGSTGVWKIYSDDDGRSWSYENSGNPVLSASGVAADADQFGCGDVVQTIWDIDSAILIYGATNLTTYTNSPLRGQIASIVPWPATAPTRKGRWYLASSHTDTGVANGILSQSTFTLTGEFKAYRTKRSAGARYLYMEYLAFNEQCYVRINTSGQIEFWYRTPTAILNGTTITGPVVDDGLKHSLVFQRVSTSVWNIYVDDVLILSPTTNTSVDTNATTKYVGNNPGTGGDLPFNGAIRDLGQINGAAWTTTECANWRSNRTLGTGGTVVFDSASNGTHTGNAVLVETTGWQ